MTRSIFAKHEFKILEIFETAQDTYNDITMQQAFLDGAKLMFDHRNSVGVYHVRRASQGNSRTPEQQEAFNSGANYHLAHCPMMHPVEAAWRSLVSSPVARLMKRSVGMKSINHSIH